MSSTRHFRDYPAGAVDSPRPPPVKRARIRSPSLREEASASQRLSSRYSAAGTQHPHYNAEEDSAIDEREEDDALNMTIMALDMVKNDTIGCCYYVAREEKLYFVPDMKYGGISVVDTIRLHAQPTIILLSSRVDEALEDHLDSIRRSNEHLESDQSALPYILELRPISEFGFEAGKRKLMDLDTLLSDCQMDFLVPGDIGNQSADIEPGLASHHGTLLRLASRIDLESRVSVGCAGSVLTNLHRRRATQFLPGDSNIGTAFRITDIEMASLDSIMYLSADTFTALQILQTESHPQLHNQGPSNVASGSKEGLSVYGLFHHLVSTPQGRYLLRQYFLRPVLNIDTIKERQAMISALVRPDNETLLLETVKDLRHIKNMRTAMVHLRKGMNTSSGKFSGIKNGVWMTLRFFALHAIGIRNNFLQVTTMDHLRLRAKILDRFDLRQLSTLGSVVVEIIDFESSIEKHRTVVNAGIDDELDEMKRIDEGIGDLLAEVSRDIAQSIPTVRDIGLDVIFYPQIGFLVSIPIDADSGLAVYDGFDEGGWERIFSTQTSAFFKDHRMKELDETFGDIHSIICDKEIEIIHELAKKVLEFEKMLCEVSDICGELDALVALARGAVRYNLVMPSVTSRNVISIKDGRHILQEFTVPNFVDNDTLIVGGSGHNAREQDDGGLYAESSQPDPGIHINSGPSMLVMTGPNYSGKSIYLKQVALIVYLAHVGSFVPASRAVIGLTDKILTRIATRETVSKPQSAFIIDLLQVSSAISLATRRSLVIVDEFGKGTDNSDGAGLMCGVLKHFEGLRDERPKVLAATHFHEIFENNYLKESSRLAFGHMEVRIDEEASEVEDRIIHLYTFRQGRSLSSFGTACAAMNGVDSAIIKRADELIGLSAKGHNLASVCAGKNKPDSRTEEEIARLFLVQDFKDPQDRFDPKQFLRQLLPE